MLCKVAVQGLVIDSRTYLQGSSRYYHLTPMRRVQSPLSSSSMKMFIDEINPLTVIDIASKSFFSSEAAAGVSTKAFTMISNLFTAISSSPQLETEILNDVSHFALDVSNFFHPRTAWLRLFNVIGRLMIITSDYIQDDTITLDEWVFQATMLAVSLHLFVQSVLPLIMAVQSITVLTVRERRTYSLLFQNVGLSVLQFKSLLASTTLDWVEYKPYTSIDLDGQYLYFLYSGMVTLPVSGSGEFKDYNSDDEDSSSVSDRLVSRRIIGEVQFAKALEGPVYKSASSWSGVMNSMRDKKFKQDEVSHSTTTTNTVTPAAAPMSRFVVGASGASILRISMHKLLQLMENDQELSMSIQRLVLVCLQEKLSRTLRNGGLVIQSSTGVVNRSSLSRI